MFDDRDSRAETLTPLVRQLPVLSATIAVVDVRIYQVLAAQFLDQCADLSRRDP